MITQKTINTFHIARRGSSNTVVIEGYHALKHALRFGAHISEIYISEEEGSALMGETVRDDITVTFITSNAQEIPHTDLLQLSPHADRTAIVALAQKPPHTDLDNILANDTLTPLVILEDPRDLDNIGACMRVVAARGCRGILISGTSNPWHARAIRAAAGCTWALPVLTISDGQLYTILQDTPVYACSDEGKSIYTIDVPRNATYLFGTERDGVRMQTRASSCEIISLPMQKDISSLNLATSVSAILYAKEF